MSTIGWGVFCASSWTWCVGMFLPLIMLLRFGWMGFLVFAIPNVIGCAAFGYVLNKTRSERIVQQHGIAATWFSVITIAFHMFFAAYLCIDVLPAIGTNASANALVATEIIEAGNATLAAGNVVPAVATDTTLHMHLTFPLLAIVGVTLLALFMRNLRDRYFVSLCVAAWIGAVVVMCILLQQPGMHFTLAEQPIGLAMLAPVICFGFLLCPYLDLTFHRARQNTPSPYAFAIFGIAFLIMIVLTCIMWTRVDLRPLLQWVIIGHIAVQGTLTVCLHFRELWHQQSISCRKRKRALSALPVAIGLGYLLTRLAFDQPAWGEAMYLRFLGFYGLVLPLYVWLFMTPWGVAQSRSNLLRFAAVIALCAPLYELGFVSEVYWVLMLPAGGFALWAIGRRFSMQRSMAAPIHTDALR